MIIFLYLLSTQFFIDLYDCLLLFMLLSLLYYLFTFYILSTVLYFYVYYLN